MDEKHIELFNCTKLDDSDSQPTRRKVDYLFIDTNPGRAKAIFKTEGVKVHYAFQWGLPNTSKYILVDAEIKKKHEGKFLKAMETLQDTVLLLGYKDYEEFCDAAIFVLSLAPREKKDDEVYTRFVADGKQLPDPLAEGARSDG